MTTCRRGATLIEVMVMITVISVVMTGAATTLVALLRLERQARSDQSELQTLANLAARWRTDVHAAIAASADDDCELTVTDGRTIRYSFAESRIAREVRLGETIVHRDAFVLPSRAQVEFTMADSHAGRLLRLSIAPATVSASPIGAPVRPAVLDAVINLHGGQRPSEDAP
jgi:type II secretory pathway pseudopilin PulG